MRGRDRYERLVQVDNAPMQPASTRPAGHPAARRRLRAFSGKVGTGFPQKMRQIKNLDRFPVQSKRKAI
jgi:hypothetical protein